MILPLLLKQYQSMTGKRKSWLAGKLIFKTIRRPVYPGTRSSKGFAAAMAVKLIIAPEVEHDIFEAYAWYEGRRVGLGEEFLGCVDACIQTICRSPGMYAVVHQGYRRGLVRRFPYSVFYEYVNNAVTIYCIFHNSQDPQKWRERLP